MTIGAGPGGVDLEWTQAGVDVRYTALLAGARPHLDAQDKGASVDPLHLRPVFGL